MTSRFDRRRLLVTSAVVGTAALAAACKKRSETCPPSQLSPEDAKVREALHYTDHSPDPQKVCSGCQQYVPNTEADCGGCKLIKGPIHPDGYCNVFVAKS